MGWDGFRSSPSQRKRWKRLYHGLWAGMWPARGLCKGLNALADNMFELFQVGNGWTWLMMGLRTVNIKQKQTTKINKASIFRVEYWDHKKRTNGYGYGYLIQIWSDIVSWFSRNNSRSSKKNSWWITSRDKLRNIRNCWCLGTNWRRIT